MLADRDLFKSYFALNNNQANNMMACAFVVCENENQAEQEQENERVLKLIQSDGSRLS